MGERCRGIGVSLDEESRGRAQIEAGLVRNHYCASTISLGEDWWRGDWAQVGKGQTSPTA